VWIACRGLLVGLVNHPIKKLIENTIDFSVLFGAMAFASAREAQLAV